VVAIALLAAVLLPLFVVLPVAALLLVIRYE
jgi:hypothetical protein